MILWFVENNQRETQGFVKIAITGKKNIIGFYKSKNKTYRQHRQKAMLVFSFKFYLKNVTILNWFNIKKLN